MSIAVIIPTTCNEKVIRAVRSVANQSVKCNLYLVVDGQKNANLDILRQVKSVMPEVRIQILHDSTNEKEKFYGHRIYSAFPLLLNERFVAFLDEDNWFDAEHLAVLSARINAFDAITSRRFVHLANGNVIKDDFESVGDNGRYLLYDTNTYLFNRKKCIDLFHFWYKGWGGDRGFLEDAQKVGANFAHLHTYTVHYEAPEHLTEYFEKGIV
jgi:hypothetical protein